MYSGASIEDFDAIKQFRASLVKFIEAAQVALQDADSDVQRALSWIDTQQLPYWLGQVRKREDLVSRCKEALRMKTLFKDATGGRQSDVDERKALQKAMRSLEEAQAKVALCKRYIRELSKKQTEYRGSTQRLSTMVYHDLPEAVVKLGNLLAVLDQYAASDQPADVKSVAQKADWVPQPKADEPKEAGHGPA